MPKFQSVVNPKEFIEVSEERASQVFRKQKQWKECVEEKVIDLPTTGEQRPTEASGERSVVSEPKRVQQTRGRPRKSNKKGS